MSKPIPKSLHTVSVLVRLADHLRSQNGIGTGKSTIQALDEAVAILGLSDAPDDYRLIDQAFKKLCN